MKRTKGTKADRRGDCTDPKAERTGEGVGEPGGPDEPRGLDPQSPPTPQDVASPPVGDVTEQPVAQSAPTTEQLQARVASLEETVLRAKADYQNLQRRTATERGEAVRYANAELMKSLLSVLDDFERTLAAARDCDNLASLVDGVRLVHQNLTKALGDQGLLAIEALHQPFDPTVHQAICQQSSADHPGGTVIGEVARGYRLWDRVIRPTQAIVAKALEQSSAPQEAVEKANRQGET